MDLPQEIDDYVRESIEYSLGLPVSMRTLELKLRSSEETQRKLRDQYWYLKSKLIEKDDVIERVRTPIAQPTGGSGGRDDLEDEEGDITNGGQREFSWLTSTWTRESDGLNRRDKNGKLAPLTTYQGDIIEGDVAINPEGGIPTELLTREMLDHWSKLNDLNGTLYYDPERYALGTLASEEYMLIPSNMAIPICPIEHIGGGLSVYEPNMLIICGVYSLAKEQAGRLNLPEQDQIKWACLRLEAFKAGWFDHQRYTAYRPMPRNSVSTFVADSDMGHMEFLRQAWPLCAFIPFLAEFYFRAYGGSYSKTNSADYLAKAQKLAAGASLSDFMGYLNQDLLYGKALAWIGVRRPMLALQNERACQCIPNVFKIRKTAAPAGQAIITTSATIINALRSAHWWEGITKTGNYNDDVLMAVAGKIRASPWKYHIMSFTYELEALTVDERKEVEEATEQAKMFAPILQAYIDVVLKNSDIAKAQALKKHSASNESLYHSAVGLFRRAKRQRGQTVAELFANTIFGVPDIAAPRNTG